MKNIEKMKALNDMELAAIAGGDDDRTIVDDFVEWLLSPIGEALNAIADSISSTDRPAPGLPGLWTPSPYDPDGLQF